MVYELMIMIVCTDFLCLEQWTQTELIYNTACVAAIYYSISSYYYCSDQLANLCEN